MSSKFLGGVATGQEREQLDGAAQCEVGKLREHVEVLRSGMAEAHHTKRASYELAAHRACVSFRTRQVLAIAITLLVIEIHPPEIGEDQTLAHALWQQWPSYSCSRRERREVREPAKG